MSVRDLSPWVKWVTLFISLIFLSILIYSVILYNQILNSKTDGFSNTKNIVSEEIGLSNISLMTRFDSKQSYHILFGDVSEDEMIIFYPLDSSDELTVISESDIIQRESVEKKWYQACHNCKLIHIVPAMLNNVPLWEVTYETQSDRYVMDYYSMHTGDLYEQLNFKKMFK